MRILINTEAELKKTIAYKKAFVYQYDFLKVAILNHSTKVAMTGSLHRTFFHTLLSKKVRENEMNNPTGVSTNEIYQGGCFKPPCEKSNDQLFS